MPILDHDKLTKAFLALQASGAALGQAAVNSRPAFDRLADSLRAASAKLELNLTGTQFNQLRQPQKPADLGFLHLAKQDENVAKQISQVMIARSQLPFEGLPIIASHFLTKTITDWSNCRSPARARRRLARGFKQNIVTKTIPDPAIYQIGNKLVMHPDTKLRLIQAMEATSPW